MGKVLLVVVVAVLTIYTLFDVIAAPRGSARRLNRPVWAVLAFVPVVGPLLWVLVGRPRRPARPERRQPPRPATGPDDDPDFLRGLDDSPSNPSFDGWEEELRRKRRGRKDPQ